MSKPESVLKGREMIKYRAKEYVKFDWSFDVHLMYKIPAS